MQNFLEGCDEGVVEGDKWQLGGSRDKMEYRSFQAAGMPFHSTSIVTLASLPSSPHDQISARRLAATRVCETEFPLCSFSEPTKALSEPSCAWQALYCPCRFR